MCAREGATSYSRSVVTEANGPGANRQRRRAGRARARQPDWEVVVNVAAAMLSGRREWPGASEEFSRFSKDSRVAVPDWAIGMEMCGEKRLLLPCQRLRLGWGSRLRSGSVFSPPPAVDGASGNDWDSKDTPTESSSAPSGYV
jgi:hypothetical protein